MIIQGTGWNGSDLHIATDDGPLVWTPGESFHWTVGPLVAPRDTPTYVFEPRAVDHITADLAAARAPEAIQRLEDERRLCDRTHVVYVAFYGTLPKVGMTSDARFQARLQEQGADAGYVVARTPERAAARDVENAISFRHRIPQWRTHKELLPQWTRPVDRERIAARADDLRQRLAPEWTPDDLHFFDHPLPVLTARPEKMDVRGHHAGTVVGAKGNYLVYEAAQDPRRLAVGQPRLVAFRRSDLEGRAIDVESV